VEILKRIWAVTWRILVFLIVWAGASSAFILPVVTKYGPPPGGGALPLPVRLYIESISAATILLTAWAMLRFVDRRPFVSLGFGRRHAAKDLGLGLLIGLAMMASCIGLFWLFGWAEWHTAGSFGTEAVALATLAMFINTITQEVLVRGYVQQTLQERFGRLGGVLASALFFLALHVGVIKNQPLPAISLFAAGVLLGTAYAVSGNLWLPIGLHFGWNLLQGPVLGQAVSGQALDAGGQLLHVAGPAIMTGGKFGVEGGLIGIAVTMLATPLLLLMYRRARS
jgi:membrane protease YdiL (CAAX protease family)